MKVSKTELTALLKQVFEGLGFASGEYENAADMIVWAQMSGLEGLRELRRGLPDLVAHRLGPLERVSEDETHAIFDACDTSCLTCSDVAMNLAYVKALARGSSSVTVLNCRNRKLLIKAVTDCGRRGMGCLMYWRDTNDPSMEHILSMPPESGADDLPRYTINRIEEQNNIDDGHRHSLFIHCSTQRLQLEQYQSSIVTQGLEELSVLGPETLRENFRSALDDGLVIEEDLWQRLQELARIVLVESSEQSRKGAGA